MSKHDTALAPGYQRSTLLSAGALIFAEAPGPLDHWLTFRDPRTKPGEVWCDREERSIPREQMGKPCPGKATA